MYNVRKQIKLQTKLNLKELSSTLTTTEVLKIVYKAVEAIEDNDWRHTYKYKDYKIIIDSDTYICRLPHYRIRIGKINNSKTVYIYSTKIIKSKKYLKKIKKYIYNLTELSRIKFENKNTKKYNSELDEQSKLVDELKKSL